MTFLQAEWRKLILVNYPVSEKVLRPYLPYRTELDPWQGTHYISLVGFMFLHTRMLGLPIPGHITFEEVNLRFYVRYQENEEWKRGVVFIKELVPRPAISLVANNLYKEHYQTVPMYHRWNENADHQLIEYGWTIKGQDQWIRVNADRQIQIIPPQSEEEFITEHYYGYTRVSPSKTFEYQVTHPRWVHYPVREYQVQVDFNLAYGPDFAYLNTTKALSVMLAEGSKITVGHKRRIQ